MIEVWFLTVLMAGGFTAMPYSTAELCNAAARQIPTAVAWDPECKSVHIMPGTIYSPPASPVPVPRPERPVGQGV